MRPRIGRSLNLETVVESSEASHELNLKTPLKPHKIPGWRHLDLDYPCFRVPDGATNVVDSDEFELPVSPSQLTPDSVLEKENRPRSVAAINLPQPPRGRPEPDGFKPDVKKQKPVGNTSHTSRPPDCQSWAPAFRNSIKHLIPRGRPSL